MRVVNNIHTQAGVTLLDVLVALIISVIVAVIAIPNYAQLNTSLERMNVRKTVLQDLRRAQAETVTHGCRGIFEIAVNKKAYSFGCDFLPYDTESPPSMDVLKFSRTLPNNFYIESDSSVIFNSKGQITDEIGFIDSRTISLSDNSSGPLEVYATGVVAGTGVFEFN